MKNKTQLSQNKTKKKQTKSQKKISEIETELQKQKEQFNALLDAIPDLVYFKDKARESLGMSLIQDLVKQIKGNIKIDGSKGTTVKINFFL
ncbi:MAG: hypothetical protein R6V00_04055 [Candidatus Aminicenantes bacterium]